MNPVKFLTKKLKKTLKDAKRRSRLKGVDFNITFEHIRDLMYLQEGKCFYTGVDFNFLCKNNSPSLDRVDSSLGYVLGNVVWCRSRVNFMKYTTSYGDFLTECRTILEHRPNWKLKKKALNGKFKL